MISSSPFGTLYSIFIGLITWEYVLRVSTMLECARSSLTSFGQTFFSAKRSVAVVGLMLWKGIRGRPVSSNFSLKCLITLVVGTYLAIFGNIGQLIWLLFILLLHFFYPPLYSLFPLTLLMVIFSHLDCREPHIKFFFWK